MKNTINLKAEAAHFQQLLDHRAPSTMIHSKEAWDGRAHHWAIEMEEDEERSKRNKERVGATVDYLLKRGILRPDVEMIDVGCGPGRFVAQFAKYTKLSMGTDISSEMLRYGAEHAKAEGVSNVAYQVCDFKKADLAELGWEKRFDFVFSSITPAIGGESGLDKLIAMSRGWCFNSCFVRFHDKLDEEIRKNVFGFGPGSRIGRHWPWFYSMLNLLMLRGYFPETYYYSEQDEGVLSNLDDGAVRYAESIAKDEDIGDMDAAAAKILAYLKEKQQRDGELRRDKGCTYGWILWNVNHRDELYEEARIQI